ncbi:MAG: hypothetical protein ACLSHO_12005 [Dysosmobacter sp.]
MHTVEALDSLILFRRSRTAFSGGLCHRRKPSRVAAQGELVALAVENGWQGDLWRCCIARNWCQVKTLSPSHGSGIPADRTR